MSTLSARRGSLGLQFCASKEDGWKILTPLDWILETVGAERTCLVESINPSKLSQTSSYWCDTTLYSLTNDCLPNPNQRLRVCIGVWIGLLFLFRLVCLENWRGSIFQLRCPLQVCLADVTHKHNVRWIFSANAMRECWVKLENCYCEHLGAEWYTLLLLRK